MQGLLGLTRPRYPANLDETLDVGNAVPGGVYLRSVESWPALNPVAEAIAGAQNVVAQVPAEAATTAAAARELVATMAAAEHIVPGGHR